MNLLTRPNGRILIKPKGRSLPLILAAALLMATSPILTSCSRGDDQPAAAPSAAPTIAPTAEPTAPPPAAEVEPGPPPGAASPEELQQLVSPIALYPDPLVAQILAGSTYPMQVVEADRWLQQNPNLTGDALAQQVNQQPWDPSIKSLTQFPSVLHTMNESLSWTSSLGEAYYNQPADVMNAIQVMRNRALAAGTLKSTPQQTIQVQPAPPASEGGGGQPSVTQTVIVQPAQPNTVYVPQYNPTSAYGAPVAAPAGYSGSDLLLTGVLSFGAGILLGSLINNGHNDWNCGWYGGGGSSVKYNNNVYVTNNNVYPGRPPGYRPPNGGYPGGGYPGGGYPGRPGYPGNGKPPYNGGGNGRPPYNGGGNGGNGRPPYNGGGNGGNGRPPYNGGGGNNGRPSTLPATRPYDKKTARPENPNFAKPNFPKPGTLPNNPGGKPNKGEGQKNRPGNQPGNPTNPARPANPGNATRPAGPKPADRSADPARGYAKDKSSAGGRNSALGGYEPGGNTRASSDRGQASMKGNNGGRGGNGGGGNRGGGGGGGNRGGGGGGSRGKGGGKNK